MAAVVHLNAGHAAKGALQGEARVQGNAVADVYAEGARGRCFGFGGPRGLYFNQGERRCDQRVIDSGLGCGNGCCQAENKQLRHRPSHVGTGWVFRQNTAVLANLS